MNLDVAIVGASQTGLYIAEKLAEAGKRVALFEQHPKLSAARRTLIVTPQFAQMLDPFPEASVIHKIRFMAIDSPGASTTIELKEPDYVIERHQFIDLLRSRVSDKGAEIFCGYRFQQFDQNGGGTVLRFHSKEKGPVTVKAKAVVGADGVFSHVAKAAGLSRPPVVPILQAEVRLPKSWDPSVTKVWIDTGETPYFYWLIPESSEKGVLGLIGDDRTKIWDLLHQFLKRHGFEALGYQGALVAMHEPRLRPWSRVGTVQVLLVGDAAGHVKVSTVGGTVSGLWGAKAAIRSLLQGSSYLRELSSLKRELDWHWQIRSFLNRMDNKDYDFVLKMVTPSVRRLLSLRNRDQMAGTFWKFLFLQPRFFEVAARLLFRIPKYDTRF